MAGAEMTRTNFTQLRLRLSALIAGDRATALQLAFEWGAGNQDGNFSWNFPLEWKAEYAVDGGEFQPLRDAATGRETFVLRSLPW